MDNEKKLQTVDERISGLRDLMRERGISVYVVPTADDHTSEYVGEHYKSRRFITGFTGSAGTAVITLDEAGLWTDGRYFVQAEKEIKDSQVKLFPMGEPDVPTVLEYVKEHLPEEGVVGFDGSCMSAKLGESFADIAEKKHGEIKSDEDLIDILWTERPQLLGENVWVLEPKYSGESTRDKLQRIRKEMQEQECDSHLIGSLYDIAWITNRRGSDISHVPVFLSFLYMDCDRAVLYCFYENWSEKILDYLKGEGIEVKPYGAVYQELPGLLKDSKKILADKEIINYKLLHCIPESVEIHDAKNPSELMKAVKNDTEVANTVEAHIRDGVAVTKFIYYIKQGVGTEPISELSASDVLRGLREEQPGFLDVSFDTICAYGANAAMMHYSAKPEDYSDLKPEGFLLVDSGGHYLEGTTDITRTIALGTLTDEMKEMYTRVLQGHLRLANAVFPKGASGQNLDVLAREPMWATGLDYRCGTGHGVGHILNVHEGPNSFRWRSTELDSAKPIKLGMITTDEPGFYQEGAYGIRIENELLCVEGPKTEYGQFYQFQNLTYAPIDLDAVIPELMSEQEKGWLNQYHSRVYEVISPYLDEKEKEWLQYETRAI